MASSISLFYEIKLNGQPLKGGMFSRKIVSDDMSDSNYGCPAAPDGTATFLNSIKGTTKEPELTCAIPAKVARSLKNVNPGECQRGKEVLAGFDASGNIVCVPIQFSAH